MGIYKKILESLAADQAKKAGLVSKGGGAWAKEKGGATVAKTVGGKLVSVYIHLRQRMIKKEGVFHLMLISLQNMSLKNNNKWHNNSSSNKLHRKNHWLELQKN